MGVREVGRALTKRFLRRAVRLARALRVGRRAEPVLQHLPDRGRRRLEKWEHSILLRSGQHLLVPPKALELKYREALILLIETRGTESLGDYLEFGVGYGSALACMYRACKSLGVEHIRLFGFDSFEGLPHTARTDDGGFWRPGQFRCDLALTRELLTGQGMDWDRTILVKGWFCDTLNNELVRRHGITKASVIMVDCDMHLSAKEALDFCAPLIQDVAVIFFDDWHAGHLADRNMGEKLAFDEFLNENPEFSSEPLEELASYAPLAEVFLVERVH